MKKKNLLKLMGVFILSAAVISMIPKKAEASWMHDSNGWWYSEGNSKAVGWRYIEGKWYYFDEEGYMAHDTVVDGCYINSSGEWIPSNSQDVSNNATTSDADEISKNTVESNTTNSADSYIGQQKAKEIAFSHAGMSLSELTYVNVKEHYEHGAKIYEVDFMYGNIEYDYKINGISGEILEYERETKYNEPNASSGSNTSSTQGTSTIQAENNISSASDIGIEEAKQIAFNHAAISSSSIRNLKVESDYEYGKKTYEIDFKAGNMKYEYDIDASSGTIMKFDKEYDS